MKKTNRRILMAIGIAVFALPILQVDAAVANVAVLQGSSLEDGSLELTSSTPKSIQWTEKSSVDPTAFEHSLNDAAKLIVKKDGDYIVAATAPFISINPPGDIPANNRPSQVIEVYVNGEPAPGTVGQSSYIRNQPRNANMHQESSDHVHALLRGLSANDVIELRVHKHSQAGIATAIQSASLYVELVDDSREVFAGLSSGPTQGTNLNPDFIDAGEPQAELGWTSTRKDGGFTHSDGSSGISLSSGTYLVFVNIPMSSGVQRISAGLEVLLGDTPVPGGLARQGMIRNSGGHSLGSVHWAGLVQVSGNQTLKFVTSRLAEAGEVILQDGKQASVYVERIDSSSGVLFTSSFSVDAEDPANWNPEDKAAVIWETPDAISDSSTYSRGGGNTQIQVRQAGSYLLVYNDAFQSTGARPSPRITVEVNGNVVPGAETKSHYIRNSAGHNHSSGTLVFLLEDLAANDSVTVSTQREADTADVLQDDFANEVATLALIKKETLVLPADDQSVPRVVFFSADIFGFEVRLQDLGLNVNEVSVQASWNGQTVSATTTKSGGVTTVSYAYPTIPESKSDQLVTLTFQDSGSPAGNHTAAFPYVIATQFTGIPGGFAASQVDTSKPGFVANVTQVSAGQSEATSLHGNAIAEAERQLAGEFEDAFGQNYYNEADLSAGFGGPWTVPSVDVPTVINFEQDGADAGNFDSDELIPGIPGSFDSTDGIAAEFLTFLELDRGFYTLGVNSDDGFKVTTGPSTKDQLAATLGFFDGGRGSTDTLFNIVVEEDGFYPFRLLWFEGDGGANVEFFSVHEGEKILINDTSNPNAIKAYREAQDRPYISSFGPVSGKISQTVDFEIVDGDVDVVSGSITLTVDGVDQTANTQINKSGGVTTVVFDNGSFILGGEHTAVLTYDESSTPVVTRVLTHSFTVPKGIAAVLLDEPTAYWGLGESDGEVAFEEVNAGLNGVYTSLNGQALPALGAERLAVGAPTTAALFSAENFNLVQLPDHDAIDNLAIEDRTIELWFNARSLPTSGIGLPGEQFVDRMTLWEQGGVNRGINIYIVGTQASNPTEADIYFFAFNNSAGSVWNEPADSPAGLPGGLPQIVRTTIQVATTYHVALVMDGDSVGLEGTITGYVNGQAVGTQEGEVGRITGNHNVGVFGAFANNGGFHDGKINGTFAPTHPSDAYYFDGVMDEVAVFDKPLSAERILAHYESGNTEVPLQGGGGAPTISVARGAGGTIAIEFTGTLQSAPNVTGPWTDVSGGSPASINTAQPGTQFFRAR